MHLPFSPAIDNFITLPGMSFRTSAWEECQGISATRDKKIKFDNGRKTLFIH